jgi:hypothetical protein
VRVLVSEYTAPTGDFLVIFRRRASSSWCRLRVRSFVCEEESCERMAVAEQVPGLTRRFGRRTERLRSTLVSVGLALAGRPGARMTGTLKVPVAGTPL